MKETKADPEASVAAPGRQKAMWLVVAASIESWRRRGFTGEHKFPGEYTLLTEPRSLSTVRVYDNGSVWLNEGEGYTKVKESTTAGGPAFAEVAAALQALLGAADSDREPAADGACPEGALKAMYFEAVNEVRKACEDAARLGRQLDSRTGGDRHG